MERLIRRMMEFYSGDPAQIQHFIKVHSFARLIGLSEGLEADQQMILEIAAIIHDIGDIGIKPAREKHGSSSGKYQETEGPPLAEKMLKELGYPEEMIGRVCYLVGHHHTYKDIDGLDYQILVEADFLINMYESEMTPDARQSVFNKIFLTQTGRQYCQTMFHIE